MTDQTTAAENIRQQHNLKLLTTMGGIAALFALAVATNGAVLFLLIIGALYFLPTICARNNGHHNEGAILVLNLLLGWTLVGWVVAMVWACMKLPVAPQTTAVDPPKTADPRWQDLRA